MLKEKINEFYEMSEPEKERDYFYISEVSDCPRKIFFKFKKAPKEPFEPVVHRKFEDGFYSHVRLMSVLYSLQLVTASEIETPKGELFHGRADAIIQIDNKNFVVEIKTLHPFRFKKIEDKPLLDHVRQVQLYMHYFKIPRGIILLESKGTQKLKEFLIELDDKMVKEILDKFKRLKQMIDKGQIPEMPDKSKWRYNKCDYCQYLKVCRKSREG